MCGIGGVLNLGKGFVNYNGFLKELTQRGRDSIGVLHVDREGGVAVDKTLSQDSIGNWFPLNNEIHLMMVNVRAVPTSFSEGKVNMSSEYLQPYVQWDELARTYIAVTHNGTIANDTEFNKEFNYVRQRGSRIIDTIPIDSTVLLNFNSETLSDALRDKVVGSFSGALWDSRGRSVVLFKNYMPLHICIDYQEKRIWWANVKDAFDTVVGDRVGHIDVPAYTSISIPTDRTFNECVAIINLQLLKAGNLYKAQPPEKALVVCSSGLDSTTVATLAVNKYGKENVTLLHYHYGCKAEKREHDRIIQIADALGCTYKMVDISTIFAGMKSPILGSTGEISTGDKGVEYAHEWVPARNLIMMSIALGVAEDGGYSTIQLGANLTEQASFPDNSLDFIEKLNTLSAYAVQNNRKVRVEAPLVNLMKQEIVALGVKAGVPYDLTWSCYHAGEVSCGICAPCQMRRQAFEMNGLVDPLQYEYDEMNIDDFDEDDQL